MAAAERSIAAEAKGLRILTVFALIAVIVAIMLQYILPSVLGLATGADNVRAFTQSLGVALIAALPAFIFASALSSTEKLFGRLAQGELFTGAVGKGVSGIGQALLFGAVAMALITPNLLAWVNGDYGGMELKLEPETLVIGVVGTAMLLMGRMFRRAGALQDELERFV
jgi:hypothetical protein